MCCENVFKLLESGEGDLHLAGVLSIADSQSCRRTMSTEVSEPIGSCVASSDLHVDLLTACGLTVPVLVV